MIDRDTIALLSVVSLNQIDLMRKKGVMMGNKERFYADIMACSDAVTGSCNLVVVRFPSGKKIRFIVDCGLFQGREEEELNEDFPFNPSNINFCLITHNHVDHIGRLPLLVRKGFNGLIYATDDTSKLMPLALWDCQKVLKENAKRKCKRLLTYNTEDVYNAINLIQGCSYGTEYKVHSNVYVTFLTNGHLVGASLIYVRITYPGVEDINLLFTGDYKGENIFLDVEPIPKRILDLPLTIVQEATYGTMDSEEMKPCFEKNLLECMSRGGTAIVPVFSLGRSQEILYKLKLMQEKGVLDTAIPIYLDGKLAIRYTHLYTAKDGKGLKIKQEMRDFLPQNLTFVNKSFRGEVLDSSDCKIVLTTSGMGSYGPAQCYLSRYVPRRGALIHFTGYTAEGTLGAILKATQNGEEVKVAGIVVKKHARVEYTTEYTAHAKANEMIAFLRQFTNLKLVLVNHGDPPVKEEFADRIFEEVSAKNVEVLYRRYFYRINAWGLVKRLWTKF